MIFWIVEIRGTHNILSIITVLTFSTIINEIQNVLYQGRNEVIQYNSNVDRNRSLFEYATEWLSVLHLSCFQRNTPEIQLFPSPHVINKEREICVVGIVV